jgi:hypothetical protein
MRRIFVRLVRANWLKRSLLTAIAVALVGTQSLGLYHRIGHSTAEWLGASQPAQSNTAEHDCAAIDALALAHGPSATAITFHMSPPEAANALGSEQSNPLVPSLQPFQARAPPVFLS